jgi:hypothetical protein
MTFKSSSPTLGGLPRPRPHVTSGHLRARAAALTPSSGRALLLALFVAILALPGVSQAQSSASHQVSFRGTVGATRQLWAPAFYTVLPLTCMVSVETLIDTNAGTRTSGTSTVWATVEKNGTSDIAYPDAGGAQGAYAQPTQYAPYWKTTQTRLARIPAFTSVRFGCLVESDGSYFTNARSFSCDIVYMCN